MVVLPLPDSPTRAVQVPRSTSNVMSCATVTVSRIPWYFACSRSTLSKGLFAPELGTRSASLLPASSGGVFIHSKHRTPCAAATSKRAGPQRCNADSAAAARGEGAPVSALPDGGGDAVHRLQHLRPQVIRSRRDETASVRMPRIAQDGLGRTLLDDPSGVHDRDPVGDIADNREIRE